MLRPDFVPDGAGQGSDGNNVSAGFFSPQQAGPIPIGQQQFGMLAANQGVPDNHPGRTGERYYTIQRVNGNGGNGKGDGVAGPHKHTLEMSDQVKKNTVQRHVMKKDKEEKKTQVSHKGFAAFLLQMQAFVCVVVHLFLEVTQLVQQFLHSAYFTFAITKPANGLIFNFYYQHTFPFRVYPSLRFPSFLSNPPNDV
jgi:hypothetical protein